MNSAKYIEIFKNGQKEGIRDVTVKRKLQTVRKFLSYLEDAQTDDLPNIDRKNVYEQSGLQISNHQRGSVYSQAIL